MAERAGLLNRCTGLNLYRGFESLPLRQLQKPRRSRDFLCPQANGNAVSGEAADIKNKERSDAAFEVEAPHLRDREVIPCHPSNFAFPHFF